MSQSISLWGATYSNVPAVLLPKSTSGTARFDDCSVVTAIASDVASGKIFVASDGTVTTGTASGGGSGLVFETGTYTTSSNIARPEISFANSHTEAPFFLFFGDVTGTYLSTGSTNFFTLYIDYEKLFGSPIYSSSSAKEYAFLYNRYRTSNSFTGASVSCTHSSSDTESSSSAYPRYWVTSSSFHPGSASTSRYWRPDRTYKWIAVWKPTT